MQQTANYNLNLPEGTDVVNPLVDYNPNFTTIDGALKAISDRTVGRATCVKYGTTHVVTRANTGSNIINFTATGDWNTGDTMTIDSTVVSVFLPDGSAALDGAYLINTEVFGILNGTRFTLYSNVVDIPAQTAANTSYDNTASGLTASNVQDAVDEIEGQITAIKGAKGYLFPVSNVDVNIASGSIFRSNGIPCDVGESLSGKAVNASAEGLGWINGFSISGNTVTVNIGRPTSATGLNGTIHIIVCDV